MYYGYGYGIDPTFLLIIIGIIISMAASAKMNAAFSRYSRVPSASGLSGAETAQRILQSQGLYDVRVQHVQGTLTDHYDPRSKTVNLSDAVYGSGSIAAVGVAAHECGHAVQDAVGYRMLDLRTAMVPVVNVGAQLSWPMILIGVMFGGTSLISIGILLFSLSVAFQLVTLPVEYNASSRALTMLEDTGILQGSEISQTREVLGAAALTYVAAAAGSLLQLLRLMAIFGGRRRD
ncbi:MAG: zinc metallopeptidase [Clostridium sp.]|nr:zinc metallopeptidase [Clostridium sp.]